MRKIGLSIIFFLFLVSCIPQSNRIDPTNHAEMKPLKNEDGEWELEVMNSQYNYFLNAIAKPMNMYSESFLKNRNSFLVLEWNSYYTSGKYSNVIESSIDYNSTENYGLKFEYQLYQVFAYVQWKYGLKMSGLSQSEFR